MDWKPASAPFQQLLRAFLQQVPIAYVVGGVVRDHLLDNQNQLTDLDLALDQPVLGVARRVADQLGWAFYPLDEARDVARLVFTANPAAPLVCDVARLRGGSLEADLRLRDFTINAMALAVERVGQATLLDPVGGQHDLQQRVIRRVSAASLADDPVRLLRAVRFAIQCNFALDVETRLQIKQICSTVTLASAERIRDELWKMLATDRPAEAIELLQSNGLLVQVLPEVAHMAEVAQSYPHFEDVYHHTLRVVRNAAQLRNSFLQPATLQATATAAQQTVAPEMARWQSVLAPHLNALRRHFRTPVTAGRMRAEWIVWMALLHDVGKPATRTEERQPDQSIRYRFFNHEKVGAALAAKRLSALRFSRQEIALVERVVAFHMRPHLLSSSFVGQPISKRAKFRFFRDAQGAKPTAATPTQNSSRAKDAPVGYDQNDGIDTVCLAIADYQAIHQQMPAAQTAAAEENFAAHSAALFAYIFDPAAFAATQRQPLVNGHTLMKRLGLPPGEQVGQLLNLIQEAQAAGEIETQEAALELAFTWRQKNFVHVEDG